ncbi:quinone oxidoreductase [Lipomyces kononenkoae]
MSSTMKAVVIHLLGGADVLKLETRPVPMPQAGQVLIRIKAFGLNRSELFTRQGHSPGVLFPRVLGIEGVGLVEAAPGGEFKEGDVVATAMGGMGRDYDGSYAEYTCVPAAQVQAIQTSLGWEILGALPEMLQTAHGALFRALHLQKGDRLLIRGGTTSVGLAAAALAKNHGAFVASTTRRENRKDFLLSNGAHVVFIDNGRIAEDVKKGQVFDKVLELVGTSTLADSLQCARGNGIVCMAGIVGKQWTVANFSPMEVIPTAVCLTTYSGGSEDFIATPLQYLAQKIASGKLRVPLDKVFKLDDIVEAHKYMEENKACGKIVVLT